METIKAVVLFALIAALPQGCGGESENGTDAGQDNSVFLCDLTTHPCPEGERCNKEQACVAAEPLSITTESLPDGRVGFGYSEQIEAEGGLEPYSWAITDKDPALDFLAISIRGKLEGNTDAVVSDASITVTVTDDGYGGGESVSKSYTLSFDPCREGDTELCYIPVGDACFQGTRTCTDGQMGDCQAGQNPSADRRQCGADCSECDGAFADACTDGRCTCGGAVVCTGDDRCCGGACTDVTDNVDHCGSCNRDCRTMIAHAQDATVSCTAGVCDYAGACDRGFLDCDGARDNGCERQVGVGSCGACDVDCAAQVAHVPTASKICSDTGTEFVCDYTGACMDDFGDCDDNRANGCETRFSEVSDCGGCGVDCLQAAEGGLCISPDPMDPYFHVCGCNYDSAEGLPEGCSGGGMVCCDHDCRDAASDAAHCGVCDAACTAGGCAAGACACSADADCPSPSGATACGGLSCVCPHAGGGAAACPPSQHCCDGQQGGSGGPQEEPDIGCCQKPCGQNDVDHACTQ